MKTYTFMLNFRLPDARANPEEYLDALYEAGCSDASVGIGKLGAVGLDFSRSAVNAETALGTAIRDVQSAIPGATLIQAGPDLVGLSEMADIFGCTRQNMRKYAIGQSATAVDFPEPVFLGDLSVWHLVEIAKWLKLNTAVQVQPELTEMSYAAAKVNFEIETLRMTRILQTA